LIFSNDLRGGVTRHPVAGAGPHGGGSVVVVVDGVTVVDVVEVLLEDELLVTDVVLVVVDVVLLVVDVLLVVEVETVLVLLLVVVVVPPISQFGPEMPGGQTQRYALDSVARQVPPFRHGSFGRHGLLGSVVVVVGPAVHADEPGGADVPGGQGAHAVAAPVENVSAGQARQAGAPPSAA
jgi:hypothetical protein